MLWDVAAEHLDEAAFYVEQFERALEHPSRLLRELDRYPEGRLRAHVDALVVGGPAVCERLLAPALEGATPDEPARVTAAALAATAAGERDRVLPALRHPHAAVRAAAVRALTLAGGPDLERWARHEYDRVASDGARAALLDLHAHGAFSPPPMRDALTSDDPDLCAAAARAARWGDARAHLPALEYLLGHDAAAVREAALTSGLGLGSARAWAACRAWGLDDVLTLPIARTLCAALGGRDEQARLGVLLDRAPQPEHTLFALAFSGDVRQVPRLVEWVRSDRPLHAKLGLQAVAGITGLDVRDDAFARPPRRANAGADGGTDDREARAALPPLEDDDLDADLVPWPEDALPLPNVVAVERFWSACVGRLEPGRRHLAGRPFGAGVLLEQLEHAPLRRRHVLARVLEVVGGAAAWLDTRGWSATQAAGLRALRAGLGAAPLAAVTSW